MGSPCEVQVDHGDPALTRQIGAIVEREALRIEAKFSRYRDDSVISSINCSGGAWFQPDTETAALLDLAAQCHAISDGRFDITSGVLREAWVFDGSDRVPDPERVRALMPLVGWSRLDWANGALRLAPGMQIDFGGLAKEYAVDRAIALVAHEHPTPVLVNFGGDLRVSGPRHDGSAWRVLIESVEPGTDRAASAWLELGAGAITTSGDVRRFVQRDGVRYSHILDPRTGWPVRNAPRAVTVAAATCTAAGILSTLAMLHGAKAERFLRKERVKAWVSR
jgi:thiamine biosynthesis lipoprotein